MKINVICTVVDATASLKGNQATLSLFLQAQNYITKSTTLKTTKFAFYMPKTIF